TGWTHGTSSPSARRVFGITTRSRAFCPLVFSPRDTKSHTSIGPLPCTVITCYCQPIVSHLLLPSWHTRRSRGFLQCRLRRTRVGGPEKTRPALRAPVGRPADLHEELLRHYLAVLDFVSADPVELDAPASLHRDVHCQGEGDGVAGDQGRRGIAA